MQSSLIIYLSLIEVRNLIKNWEIGQSNTYFINSEWIFFGCGIIQFFAVFVNHTL